MWHLVGGKGSLLIKSFHLGEGVGGNVGRGNFRFTLHWTMMDKDGFANEGFGQIYPAELKTIIIASAAAG